jgi:fumarylpyruvate hydrolase
LSFGDFLMAAYVVPAAAVATLPVAGGGVFPIRRVFCVGRNYADHAREMGGDPTREPPLFFTKPADAVTLAAEILFDTVSKRLEYEGELVVAIGKGGSAINPAAALDHIYGYSVGCDLTRRDMQLAASGAGRPWDMAKGFDLSAPTAPIQPATAIGHPAKGALTLSVNGHIKQNGDLADMIWKIPEVIAYLSHMVTLAPGDLIFTGTPAGVGPLARGDVVEVTAAGVAQHRFKLV